MEEFKKRAEKCASFLKTRDNILVVSHIDADGLASAGIVSKALEREKIDHDVWFSKKLDAEYLNKIEKKGFSTVLFTDFGSALLDNMEDKKFDSIVVDHHQPKGDKDYHLNPLIFGIDGASEISGAGSAYFLAKALGNGNNRDLATLAVVGAVGDMQNYNGNLEGLNRIIAREAEKQGGLKIEKDIQIFGRQSRPVYKLLKYSSIPGISENKRGALKLLRKANVDLKSNGKWRYWTDLTKKEKKRVVSLLVEKSVNRGLKPEKVQNLVGEVYILRQEPKRTELREATEFSTLLNSTARYEKYEIGFNICKGKRGDTLKQAQKLLRKHRRNLKRGVSLVSEKGVNFSENLQWFDLEDNIRDTIVGIIAQMSYSKDAVDSSLPVVALADSGEKKKVSARAPETLIENGLNLAEIMEKSANQVDGSGGGHDIAAGAEIPEKHVKEFIQKVDEMIGKQV